MPLAQLSVATLALFGHGAVCLALFNRLHAMGLPRWLIGVLEKPLLLYLVGLPGWVIAWIVVSPEVAADPLEAWLGHPLRHGYFWLCFGVAVLVIAVWIVRAVQRERFPMDRLPAA